MNPSLTEEMHSFIEQAAIIGVEDTETLRDAAVQSIRFSSKQATDDHPLLDELFRRWYAALEKGTVDYSVYTPEIYLAHLYACWRVYSRRTVSDLGGTKSDGLSQRLDGMTVADLGCGLGYTSAALARMLPNSIVYATSLPDTVQREFADSVARQHKFTVLDTLDKTGLKIDV